MDNQNFLNRYNREVPYHAPNPIVGHADYEYLRWAQEILWNGIKKGDRTGTGTLDYFGGGDMKFDLSKGFPLITTKKIHLKSVVHELLWLLSGSTNIQYLIQNKVSIWSDWPYAAYKKSSIYQGETLKEFEEKIAVDNDFSQQWGDLGPVYGKQWRNWEGSYGRNVDQIQDIIEMITKNPDSRRIIVNAWNAADIGISALPPCHAFFQFDVTNGYLSCKLYQRSADWFLGVPFNIASYSLLTMMIAQVTGLKPGVFHHTFGSAHIYSNHLDKVVEQINREPRNLPTMKINPNVTDIFSFTYEDFILENYDPHPAIKADVAV